jgi:ankyrin repeat protein
MFMCKCLITILLRLYSCIQQQGFTALYAASQNGRKDMVELLLDSGASVDKANTVI